MSREHEDQLPEQGQCGNTMNADQPRYERHRLTGCDLRLGSEYIMDVRQIYPLTGGFNTDRLTDRLSIY